VIGLDSSVEGEAHDRHSINLPGACVPCVVFVCAFVCALAPRVRTVWCLCVRTYRVVFVRAYRVVFVRVRSLRLPFS
jgi:hypothetical protein